MWGGEEPYTFTWDGQFDNSDGSPGPKGPDQIVSGITDDNPPTRPAYLTLQVTDGNNNTDDDEVNWSWGDFNDERDI